MKIKSRFADSPALIRKGFPGYVLILDTPLGRMKAVATDKGICYFTFADSLHKSEKTLRLSGVSVHSPAARHLKKLTKELRAYFEGRLKKFTVKLDLKGTPFQRKAWEQLLKIPYGTTWTYRQQATMAGCPRSIRAVGQANRRNPVAIVVPCHRVIGADGRLTGYDGGLWRKQFLLELERRFAPG